MRYLLCAALIGQLACTEDNESAAADAGVEADGESDAGEGGEGGEGGAAGEGGMGGMGGMGGEGGEGGGEPSEACVASCARFGECAMEVCQEMDADDGPQLTAWCLDACAENGSFVAVADGIATCNDLVAFGRQTLDPEFDQQCSYDPANPPTVPECDPFGERITTCMLERCPAMEPGRDILEGAYTHICNEQVALGALDPMQLPAFAGPNTACDAMILAGIVDEQIMALGENCEDGPTPPIPTCEEACERVAECLPPDDENASLRVPDRCQQLCIGARQPADGVWECAAEKSAGQCAEVFQCFGDGGEPPPPAADVPECEAYGARLTACLIEDCANLGDVGGLGVTMEALCDGQVAAGNLMVEGVDGVDAETPCDDPLLAGYIAFFLNDRPENDDDGGFRPICDEGPANPPELCQTACEVGGPCIPEGSEGAGLRDLDACVYFCGTSREGVSREQWQCMSEIEACAELGACFQ